MPLWLFHIFDVVHSRLRQRIYCAQQRAFCYAGFRTYPHR